MALLLVPPPTATGTHIAVPFWFLAQSPGPYLPTLRVCQTLAERGTSHLGISSDYNISSSSFSVLGNNDQAEFAITATKNTGAAYHGRIQSLRYPRGLLAIWFQLLRAPLLKSLLLDLGVNSFLLIWVHWVGGAGESHAYYTCSSSRYFILAIYNADQIHSN